MNGFDKFETIVNRSSFAVAILINPVTDDVELIPLQPVAADTAQCFTARGLTFGGCIGLIGGRPTTALALPIEGETAQRVIARFLEIVESEINARVPQAESVAWLRKLWSRPDTRVN